MTFSPGFAGASYCGCTKSISHHFEHMAEPILAMCRGVASFPSASFRWCDLDFATIHSTWPRRIPAATALPQPQDVAHLVHDHPSQAFAHQHLSSKLGWLSICFVVFAGCCCFLCFSLSCCFLVLFFFEMSDTLLKA